MFQWRIKQADSFLYLFRTECDILWKRKTVLETSVSTCQQTYWFHTVSRVHTHLFDQSLMLLWLAKVAANILHSDCAFLALVHPALVLVLLRQSVPEDLESLPHGFLAHWSPEKEAIGRLTKPAGLSIWQCATGTKLTASYFSVSFFIRTFLNNSNNEKSRCTNVNITSWLDLLGSSAMSEGCSVHRLQARPE